MRKCFRFFQPVVILVTLILVGGIAVAQENMTSVQDSAFQDRERPRAVFNHDAHNEAAGLDCGVCHHVYKDGKLVEDETSEDSECSQCHAGSKDRRHLDLVVAFHKRCKGCHEEEKQGPVTCNECHVKQ